jgi:uncharacterized membrane protein
MVDWHDQCVMSSAFMLSPLTTVVMILGELCNFAGACPGMPIGPSHWLIIFVQSVRFCRSISGGKHCRLIPNFQFNKPHQTPLGALSVVISAVMSSIFLNEKLTFFGWLGCALCIVRPVPRVLDPPNVDSWLDWIVNHRLEWQVGQEIIAAALSVH